MKPCVSVTMWRLRPTSFFPASNPRIPPLSVVLTLWLSMSMHPAKAALR